MDVASGRVVFVEDPGVALKLNLKREDLDCMEGAVRIRKGMERRKKEDGYLRSQTLKEEASLYQGN